MVRREARASSLLKHQRGPILDEAFYRSRYPDLSGLSAGRLRLHWMRHGREEGRFSSQKDELVRKGLETRLPAGFCPEIYLALNPDLADSGLELPVAGLHFVEHGYFEGREWEWDSEFYREILQLRGIDLGLDSPLNHWVRVGRRLGIPPAPHRLLSTWWRNGSALAGLSVDLVREANWRLREYSDRTILYALVTQRAPDTIWPSPDERRSGKIFLELAQQRIGDGEVSAGVWLLRMAALCGVGRAMELLGNEFLTQGDSGRAFGLFSRAASSGSASYWAFRHAMRLRSELTSATDLSVAAAYGFDGYLLDRARTDLRDEALVLAELAFHHQLTSAEVAAVCGDTSVDAQVEDASEEWTRAVRSVQEPYRRGRSANRATQVSLIADLALPQCVRYRVEQRVHMFETLGLAVEVLPWNSSEVVQAGSFSDLVWFYRAPATTGTLEACESARLRGIAVAYEIDDLVFADSYPSPFPEFEGAVTPDAYVNLRVGAARYRALLRRCAWAVGSTPEVARELERYTGPGTAVVIPNCLDAHHRTVRPRPVDTGVSGLKIALATGSLAHVRDFSEAYRALDRLVGDGLEFQLRLFGDNRYLSAMPSRLRGRVELIETYLPPAEYQALLGECDLSLAPMRRTAFNDGKSEIRWLDAAAAGVPVVASPVAPYKRVAEAGALLLAHNENEWYEAIRLMLQDEGARVEIMANADSLKEYFAFDRQLLEFDAWLRRVWSDS